MTCSSCGHPVEADARFCPHCGAPQSAPVGERRIVTVLFADIVGFTSLAERRDPEEVKLLVDRAFERLVRDITTFGGVVDKILGDGIIALFGAPVAHEDDAERAVRAGMRMQQTMQALSQELHPPISVRIGINTGEVLVGATAGGDYTAMGDVVNSADRLQKLAQPGQILVGAATRDGTGDAIAYEAAGSLPARGRLEPLEAWVAVQATRPPGFHRQRGAAFVGRRHELELLLAQSRLAFDGKRAQLALVVGDAGVGKTRLVHEAAATVADQHGARLLEGRCLPYGEANVWWPVADLVRDLFDLSLDAPQSETEVLLVKGLESHLDDPSMEEVERTTVALLHALGYDTPLRGGDRSRNRSEVILAMSEVLAAELRRRPVVLVMSDMHWAAEAVWRLFDHLFTDLVREGLLVFMTTRPAQLEHLPEGRHGQTRLQLGPLDSSASAALLAELGPELEPAEIDDLVARSGGNPFFLEELAGLVSTVDPSRIEGSEFDVEVDGLPATLQGIIAARLDALAPDERALLEDAAVLGRAGPVDGLSRLVEETRGVVEINGTLDALVGADLLVLDGGRYRFRSNLVRDVTYGRLTKTVRARQHLGIANYLENMQGATIRNSVVVRIAEHYRAAAQLSNELSALTGFDQARTVERALYWLEQAGDRALDVGEPGQAARWYAYGVALADDSSALQARFLFGRAKARTEIHDLPGARSDLARLAGFEDLDPVVAARAELVRGDVHRKAGEADAAAASLIEAADRLEVLDEPTEQALALRLLGMTEMVRSDARARAAFDASRRVAVGAGNRRAEGWALQSMAWHAFRTGRADEAEGLVDESIACFEETEDRGALAWAQGVKAWVAFHKGDWDQAKDLLDRVLPETKRRGDPQGEGIMLNLDSIIRLWSGRAQEAYEVAREARTVAERVDVTLSVMSMAIEGRALVSLGRIDDGTAVLEEAFRAADQAGDRESIRVAVISNTASAARLGESERSIRWAARYDGASEDPTIVGEADLVVSLALALLQRGSVSEAATHLDWAGGPDSTHFAEAVGALVSAADNDRLRAEELVAMVMSGSPTYLDRVLAHLALAAVAARDGDDVAGEVYVARARAELEPTDDVITRRLVDLAAALFGRGSVPEAEQGAQKVGLDPVGWSRAFALAAGALAAP